MNLSPIGGIYDRAVGRLRHRVYSEGDDPLHPHRVVNESPEPEGSDVDEFFVEGSDHSKVKTTIATKYFFTWADIVGRKTRSNRIGYVDLYAGPGRFMDGTKSTPLLILERAINDPRYPMLSAILSSESGGL